MFLDKFLTAQEIAGILKISKALAYRLVSQGQIQGVRFGRTVRIRPEDFEAFITKNLQSYQIESVIPVRQGRV